MNTFVTQDVDLDTYISLVRQFNLSSKCIKFIDETKSRYTIWTDMNISDFHIEIRTSSILCPAIPLSLYKEMKWDCIARRYEERNE